MTRTRAEVVQLCQNVADRVSTEAGLPNAVRVLEVKDRVMGVVDGRSAPARWAFDVVVDLKAMARLGPVCRPVGTEIATALDDLVSLVCRSELAHWRYCPYDADSLAGIVEGIAKGVASAVPPLANPERLIRRLAGLYCDLVANACLAAWADQEERDSFVAAHALRTMVIAEGSVSGDVGVLLWVEQWTVGGNARGPIHSKARRALSASMGSCRSQLRRAAWLMAVRMGLVQDGHMARGADAARLLGDRSRWQEAAMMFAETCAGLCEGSSPPLGSDVIAGFRASSSDDEATTPRRRPKKAATDTPLSGGVLECLYRARGDEVALAFEDIDTSSSAQLEIAWTGVRPYESGESISLSDVKLSATRMLPGPEGQAVLSLYRRERPLLADVRGTGRVLPDLAWIVDSSGSMEWKPLAPEDGGKFDRLLRTVFGVWRSLERRGLADHVRHAAVNFSSNTICSGWQPWACRSLVDKVLFTHQNGRSTIDGEKLLLSLLSAHRMFVALFVTDGAVDNPDGFREVFDGLRRGGHQPILIDVSDRPAALFGDLQRLGYECHFVPDATSLSELTIGTLLPRHILS